MLKDFVQGTYGTMYYVRDMNKAVAFYTDLLGKAPAHQSDDWTTFSLGDSNLCLHSVDAGVEIDGKGVLIINTKNLKEKIPVLKEMGIEIQGEYRSVCEGGYSLTVRDPNGNSVDLFEYTGK